MFICCVAVCDFLGEEKIRSMEIIYFFCIEVPFSQGLWAIFRTFFIKKILIFESLYVF